MSKIYIETSIKQNKKTNKKLSILGILQDGIVKYTENNTMNILDTKEETLKRKNKEKELIIDFKNEIIKTNYNNYNLELKIKVKSEIKKENYMKIEYILIDTKDIFEYEIKWR